MPHMNTVYICSPYAGDINENIRYARAAMRHALLKGEAPYVPHLLYTQPGVLQDSQEEERKIGMKAGHAVLKTCNFVAVYHDRGISKGMMEDMRVAAENGVVLEFRSLREGQANIWTEKNEIAQTLMWLEEQDRVKTE